MTHEQAIKLLKLSVIKDKSIYYCVNCWLKTRFIYFKKDIQNEYRI